MDGTNYVSWDEVDTLPKNAVAVSECTAELGVGQGEDDLETVPVTRISMIMRDAIA